jgi:hypothetical protein
MPAMRPTNYIAGWPTSTTLFIRLQVDLLSRLTKLYVYVEATVVKAMI